MFLGVHIPTAVLVDIQVRFLIRPTTTIGYTNGGSTGLEAEGHRESREETHF
jgi:hypothetical protein